jgi:ElaB/YqjD/DUF883 family membrane-anchored ribosome-binding protein
MIQRVGDTNGGLAHHAEHWKEEALDLGATAREQFLQGTRVIREYTLKKPATALGVALGIGVFLGWLMKRR